MHPLMSMVFISDSTYMLQEHVEFRVTFRVVGSLKQRHEDIRENLLKLINKLVGFVDITGIKHNQLRSF